MNSNLKKLIVPAISAAVGGAAVLSTLKLMPTQARKLMGIQSQFENMFNDEFFGQQDPFGGLKNFRFQMGHRLNGINGSSMEEISKREDDNYVYYEIKIENLTLTSMNTKVENGQISITGSLEKRDDSSTNETIHSYFKTTFARSFPLPEGVDIKKMETVPEKDKITLKFPKLKT